jgi:thioesterase domain-containing protein
VAEQHDSDLMVSKRYFFHVSGFDPYEPAAQHRRFVRETARFEATWNVTAQVSALQHKGASESCWTVTTQAPGWQVVTTYELLDWSDIVRDELKRPAVDKLHGGLSALADLVVSGTAARYFAANWRYGMFFLVPFLNVFLFAATALLAAYYVGTAVAPALLGLATAVAAAAIVFSGLMRWLGERWSVGQALADWMFARDYMLGRHARIKARVDDFAARVVACAHRADVDEIVVAGHSLGATVAVDVLARAFDRDPALGQHGPKLCLLTIGATIPKVALHPRGAWLREQAQRLADEPSLAWAEYQARDDFISFHKFDPVRLVRTEGRQSGPTIHRVQIHNMLSKRTMRRFRFKYMRLHYQFVMANERRAVYDYFMLMCGPAPFRQTIAAPDGPAGLYRADGSYAGSCIDGPGSDGPATEVPGVPPADMKVNGRP